LKTTSNRRKCNGRQDVVSRQWVRQLPCREDRAEEEDLWRSLLDANADSGTQRQHHQQSQCGDR
jgi:hypothetical protein